MYYYYQKNREFILKRSKIYYKNHKNERLNYIKKYYENHPEKLERNKLLKALWRKVPDVRKNLQIYQKKYWSISENREKHNLKRRVDYNKTLNHKREKKIEQQNHDPYLNYQLIKLKGGNTVRKIIYTDTKCRNCGNNPKVRLFSYGKCEINGNVCFDNEYFCCKSCHDIFITNLKLINNLSK